MGNAYDINRMKSRDNARDIMIGICRECDRHGIEQLGVSIPHERNTVCDAGSKAASFADACRCIRGSGSVPSADAGGVHQRGA